MKWRDESIFDSFRFPLRGILSEGKASPSDLISTRHDCARYCRYINLEDDRTRVTIFSRSANFVSRRRGTASFFGRFDRGSSKRKCGRSISFPATAYLFRYYRSTRSNYRETACKRGERKSLFAFTDESAFENANDRSF